MIENNHRGMIRNESGRAAYKLAIGSCLVALAAASTSPAFETNPLVGETVYELRQHLPATLDTIREAMGG